MTICVLDRSGAVVAVNRAWCRFYEENRNSSGNHAWFVGADYLAISEMARNEEAEAVMAGIRQVLSGEAEDFRAEYSCHSSSTLRWFGVRGTLLKDGEHIVLAHEDITARKLAEQSLQLAASVFRHAGEGITISNADGTIIDVNDSFTRITGYSREEAIGQNSRLLKSGRHGPDFYTEMWRALLADGHWRGEIWNRHKDGRLYAEMITITTVRDEKGGIQNFVALFTDITEGKEHEQQLEHIAHFDGLTGLPNRLLLADRLGQAMAQSERNGRFVAVVYLDLDGFKLVNDRHGHDGGDELLVALARRMKMSLRDGDTLARIGGDEFVAVLSDLDRPEDCEIAANRLLVAAASPVMVGEHEVQLSASIGVTLYPDDAADADMLLRHADQAMYSAKQGGKNRYHYFDVEQDAAASAKRVHLDHLRQALDRGEFALFYQPKVNMRQGVVIGMEALIRWQHPERGLLSPGEFLPLIEGHPLSIDLGNWVIGTALAQMDRWRLTGPVIPVSVNIGAVHLQQSDFAIRLRERMCAYPGIEPGWLELEILETSALEDMATVSYHLDACSRFGVGCALDDFGTGYSSLAYLRRLPTETLKIDQSFVRGMLDDEDDRLIVEGVIGLARAFQRRVIAEGVETIAHGAALLAMGCDLAQGYGIARPMPADEVQDWVLGWRPDPSWSAKD